MTTALIRSFMADFIAQGGDPTEVYWFDVTGMIVSSGPVSQEPLHGMRPPFERCIVCRNSVLESGRIVESTLIVSGCDPEEGIAIALIHSTPAMGMKLSTELVYRVVDGKLSYAPSGARGNLSEHDALAALGFVSAWLETLNQKPAAYVPSVRPTLANKLKIAKGKPPSYEWHTVVIEPSKLKREHQGGTHASPRLHDRRGHWRTYPSGKRGWVKPCKVGDASKGAVFKDYEVKS